MDHELIQSVEAATQSALAMGDLQASHIAIYLTMIFAYISVAYFAGKALTRLQLGLTTFVFLAASAREVVTISALAGISHQKAMMAAELAAQEVFVPAGGYSIWYSVVVWSSGIVCALIFMWSVRHPKE